MGGIGRGHTRYVVIILGLDFQSVPTVAPVPIDFAKQVRISSATYDRESKQDLHFRPQ